MEERLQKILASFGIASRRKAEELIADGIVTVNGAVATLGMKADPARDHIKVGGKLITRREPLVYYAFYKPEGVLTTMAEGEDRPTVNDFLGKIRQRVYPVGRLDYNSEGLMLLTNDGDLANAILHPSRKIPKTYHVKIKGVPEDDKLQKLRDGVRLEDGNTMPALVKRLRPTPSGVNTWIEITIYEGRKRQIRRMLDSVNYTVITLKRVAIDGIRVGDMKPGEIRALTESEIERLKKEIGKSGPHGLRMGPKERTPASNTVKSPVVKEASGIRTRTGTSRQRVGAGVSRKQGGGRRRAGKQPR